MRGLRQLGVTVFLSLNFTCGGEPLEVPGRSAVDLQPTSRTPSPSAQVGRHHSACPAGISLFPPGCSSCQCVNRDCIPSGCWCRENRVVCGDRHFGGRFTVPPPTNDLSRPYACRGPKRFPCASGPHTLFFDAPCTACHASDKNANYQTF